MTHVRACHLCEAMCGVVVETDGERVVAVRGDEADPFSQGHICPKATALGDIHHDPDRLKRPLRRTARGFEEIEWDEAFDLVASRLREIRAEHGKWAVGVYQGNPTVHNYGSILFGQLFIKALRTRSLFSATSVDQLPKMLAALQMFGHQLLMSVPDVDRTDYLLVFGANPLASNGSIMSAPDMRRRLAAIRARGGRVVVLDPRRSETARAADEHVFVKPGSDALVLFAMLHTLFDEKLVRLGRFADAVSGLDELERLARGFAPESVASATGIPAATVRRLARELAAVPRGVVYGRVGVSMQEFGGIACWLVEVLNVLTGHFDEPGGAMFTTPAVDLVKLGDVLGQRGHFGAWRTRVRGAPEFGGELPAACLAEEIETPGQGQIRALVTMAGNPVLSTPNGTRLERALPGLDFMVSVDVYLNETTRHAHVILPPTFGLEHDHYDVALHAFAVRNTAKYSPALFTPKPDQRHDWQILLELATRLGGANGAAGRILAAAQRRIGAAIGPRGMVDAMIRMGPHGLRGRGLTLAEVEASVHGVDLGALEPCMPERLYTKDRRIALAPDVLVADVERLRTWLAGEVRGSDDSLLLVGRRQLRSNNSWCHNAPKLMRGPDRCTLLMHPADAKAGSLEDGAHVRITSRVGSVIAPLEISDEVMPGVVSLPHGFGHHRAGTRLSVASARPGVSINDLTDDAWIDALAGTASFSGVPVRVEAVANA